MQLPLASSSAPSPASRPASAASLPPTCPVCSALMRRKCGEYGGFFACSRYPACRGTMTQLAARRQVASRKPLSELADSGDMEILTIEDLKEKIRAEGVPVAVSGTKKELIGRITDHFSPPTDREVEQRELDKQRDREQEQRERVEEDRLWQTEWLVPASIVKKKLAHRTNPESFPAEKNGGHNNNSNNNRNSNTINENVVSGLTRVKANDFAVGLLREGKNPSIVFFSPKSRRLLAVLTRFKLRDAMKLPSPPPSSSSCSHSTSSSSCPHAPALLDYHHRAEDECDVNDVYSSGKKTKIHHNLLWQAIFTHRDPDARDDATGHNNQNSSSSSSSRRRSRQQAESDIHSENELVCVMQRDSDSSYDAIEEDGYYGDWGEWHEDAYTSYVKRTHPPRGWGFSVSRSAYVDAWSKLIGWGRIRYPEAKSRNAPKNQQKLNALFVEKPRVRREEEQTAEREEREHGEIEESKHAEREEEEEENDREKEGEEEEEEEEEKEERQQKPKKKQTKKQQPTRKRARTTKRARDGQDGPSPPSSSSHPSSSAVSPSPSSTSTRRRSQRLAAKPPHRSSSSYSPSPTRPRTKRQRKSRANE